MCFTISIKLTRDALEKRFNADASALEDFEYRYFYRAFDNPKIPVVTQSAPNTIELMQWGLIPHWADDAEQAAMIRKGTYNARAESIGEKPSFKRAYQQSRCWVLVKGFFEWQLVGKERIPWFIHAKNDQAFAMAGIYDTWTDPDTGSEVKTFSIVTTKANGLMEKIHNTKRRMPVILDQREEKLWITKGSAMDHHPLLLKPADEKLLEAHTISREIGSKAADPNDEKIILPYEYYRNNTLFD